MVAPAVHAQAARFIPYQGHLEHNGQALNEDVSVTFTIFNAESGGAQLHSESQTVSPVNGSFATRIGPVPEAVFVSPQLYLELTVDGFTLAGRQRIETSPYAIRGQPGASFRADALTLDNGASQVTLTPTTSAGRQALSVSDIVLEYGIQSPRLTAFPPIANSNQNHFGDGSLSGTFSDPGGTIVLLVSGSAWTTAGVGRIQLQVTVDGVTVGALRAHAHRVNEHITLPPAFIRLDRGQFAAGTPNNPITRTVELRPINCASGCTSPIVTTRVDLNDFGNVMVIRLPTP